MRAIYRLVWIPSAVALIAMTCIFAMQPISLHIPSPETKHYVSADRSIRIAHPANWPVLERSSHGIETEIGVQPAQNAKMIVSVDLQSSLVADILKAQNTQTTQMTEMIPGAAAAMGKQETPLEAMHKAQGARMKKDKDEYPGFKDGDTVHASVGGKDALVTTCQWTAPGLFKTITIVGRRATILSGDHGASVVFGCAAEEQKLLIPEFDSMLDSLQLDVQGGSR